jgi:hypothetical protein
MSRIKTVERDPEGGWIARNPHTGEVILGDDFRWNSRESARGAVWEAKHLTKPADGVESSDKEKQG